MPTALRLSLVDLAFPTVVAVDLLPAVVVVDLVLPTIVVVDLALPAIVVVALPAVVAVDLTSYSPVPRCSAGTKARQRQLVHDDNRVKHNGNGTHWHKAASNAVARKPTSWPATAMTTDNNNTADDAADDGGDTTMQQTTAAT
ncbi:hypothetical protein EDB89DRAFT_1914069 [Lactarius sanguifluus]|nr:hypothetical protein EDB89DRAFT_1914069 [Lactarius sanguifluus]